MHAWDLDVKLVAVFMINFDSSKRRNKNNLINRIPNGMMTHTSYPPLNAFPNLTEVVDTVSSWFDNVTAVKNDFSNYNY